MKLNVITGLLVTILIVCACSSSSEEPIITNDPQGDETPQENPNEDIVLPSLGASEIMNIGAINIEASSSVIASGSSLISEKGFVWNTLPNPTISNNRLSLGQGIDSFSATIESLETDTTYYVRAYATNDGGTSYGEELTFQTLNGALVLSTQLLNVNIFHNSKDDLLYFMSYDRDSQGFAINPLKITVFNYKENQVIVEKEFDNITWTDFRAKLAISDGVHNGRFELYIVDDFGKILVVDGTTLDIINTIELPGQFDLYTGQVLKVNNLLFVGGTDRLYTYDRSSLTLLNSVDFSSNGLEFIGYNKSSANQIELAVFSGSGISTFQYDLMGNRLSAELFDRVFGAGADLLKTNDEVDFVLTGSETILLWKSGFDNQEGEQVAPTARDVFISEDGSSVYILGVDSTLRIFDSDDLFGTPSELPVVSAADNVFVDDGEVIIIDYPFWRNQSEEIVDVWIYKY
ncbi:fibronectin type III domain-containing protein [Flagellimonas sp. CMM7]|uniref:fibronectin type III domain-containing protein n=1 Tax=Flagellimonas sp. CMM7 TaxID=2654676 RepID=UPI0013D3A2A9|nr:fibronectin type III domain-containing protein [Flagellimonas sp. CMM7]UII80816.1 fibronectin type III domain-containing protein [Flagellimonas sp. CMM7]